MSENQGTQNISSIVPTASSPVEAPVIEPTLSTPTSPNPELESQAPSVSSPTQLNTGFHRSRKTWTPKKFVAVTSPSASPKKMVEEDTVEEEENQEISSLPVEENSAMSTPGIDLNAVNYIDNAFSMPSKCTLELQEQKTIENILSIATEGSLVGGYEGMYETNGS
ncbi:hypothetical protein A4A49_40196 [Nicotiana attenuata]|uniref:Uncharacterized protein n=1 Tax=Nicotiana attenuata TaxID=49451 RepID=A0A1J6KAC0_NICAT|nr:hypothetical protein A4A49_40196 [Nicotiana attenuata]